MENEDYVSLEIAKLLKKKNYTRPCNRFYCKMYDKILDCKSGLIGYSSVVYDNLEEGDILIPSLYDVQQWFIGQYGIFIEVDFIEGSFDIEITDMHGNYNPRKCDSYRLIELNGFISYQKALERGIKETLKLKL